LSRIRRRSIAPNGGDPAGEGIDARVGDAQSLPFDECDFDVVLAAFRSENGEAALRPHFARVERRDVRGWFVVDDDAVLGYTQSWEPLRSAAQGLPLPEPLRVRYVNTVFVAETASGA